MGKQNERASLKLYDADGDPVQVLGRTVNGQVVTMDHQGVVSTGRYDEDEGLYASPDEGIRATITLLRSQKNDLERRTEGQRTALVAATAAHKKRLDEIARLDPALASIEDFLSGKFTHFAFIPQYGSVSVKTMSEALETDDWDGRLRLIILSGRLKGGLTWEVNQNCDGSGHGTTVEPCKSEEKAREAVRREIAVRLKGDGWRNWITDADEFGVDVLPHQRDEVMAQRFQEAEMAYTEAKGFADTRFAKLEELRCLRLQGGCS